MSPTRATLATKISQIASFLSLEISETSADLALASGDNGSSSEHMDTPPPLTPEPIDPVDNPPPTSGQDRSWCIGLHLSGLAGLLFSFALAHIIAPLIIWLVKRAESPVIDATGKEVLNFQISYTLYFAVSALLWFFCVGFFVTGAFAIAWLAFIIIAAIKTSNGEFYRYPYIIRFLK